MLDNPIRLWQRIWIFCLLLLGVLMLLYLYLPVDGSSGDVSSLGSDGSFTVRWLLEERPSGLMPGDVIEQVNHKPFESLLPSNFNSPGANAVKQVPYLVLRDGEEIELIVSYTPLNLQSLLIRRYANLFIGLVFLVLSGVFLWKTSCKGLDWFASVFFLAAGILTLMDVFNLQPGVLFSGWMLWVTLVLYITAYTILSGIILHYALLFPKPHGVIVKKPRLMFFLVYFTMPAVSLAAMVFSDSLAGSLQLGVRLISITALLQILLSVVLLVSRGIRTKDMIERLRLTWLAWAVLLSLLSGVLFWNIGVELAGHPLLPAHVLWTALIFLSCFIASNIPERRLMYIDVIINQTIVYVSLLVILGSIYVLLVRFLEWILDSTPLISNRIYLTAALLTALSYGWLKPQIQSMVNRFFFRSTLSIQRLLPWLQQQIAQTVGLEQLAPWLIKELPYHLQINNAALLVLDTGEHEFLSVDDNHYLNISSTHALAAHLRQHGKSILRIMEEKDMESEARVYLQKNAVELSIPLLSNAKLNGIINLGSKLNGTPYTYAEINLLCEFSRSAAIALNHARVYQELNQYNQTLEMQVKQKTTELAHAVHESEEERLMAERANRAKSVFLGSVSHQIRTPMNAVLGMVDLLLNTPLESNQRDYIDSIQQNGETLLKTINDILDYSLIESGKLELEHTPFKISSVIESVLDTAAPEAAAKHIELSYLLEAHTPLTVIGDKWRLQQILLNLLERAIRYSSDSEIVIFVTSKSLDEPHKQELHFSIKDSGSSIPPEIMASFFQPFQSVDSIPNSIGGTGLGLTVSKLLSEAMGGTMWVESSSLEGRGSTVHFTLMVEAEETTYPAYLDVEQPLLEGKRVLLVNPNVQERKTITLQLQSWGMHTFDESSAEEALETLRSSITTEEAAGISAKEAGRATAAYEKFDAAIISYQLPGMDGMNMSREIRRFLSQDELPIILLLPHEFSGRDDWNTGIVEIIEEPYEAVKLFNALTAFFIGQVYLAPAEKEKAQFDERMAEYHPLDILLVEDNPTNKKLAILFLEGLGYQADTAVNGLEALELVQKKAYDVVLMDVKMPAMDGLETTRKIRKILPSSKQPCIIAMTAEAMQDDRQKCLDAGMDDYLSKPIRIWELINALSKYKKQSQPVTEDQVRSSRAFTLSNLQRTVPLSQRPSTVGDAAESDALDNTVLEQLRTSFGSRADAVMPKLVNDYIHDAQSLIQQARQALSENDAEVMMRSAHTLKSNSAALGAAALSALAKQLETQGRNQVFNEAPDLLTQIEGEFERVKSSYRQRGYLD